MTIQTSVKTILAELPPSTRLLAAVKDRTPEEITLALGAGLTILGENYVQEAEAHINALGRVAEWHFIGHLQKNKVKKAVRLFDMIETVDSLELAAEISKRSIEIGKVMPVLIEVNIGREPNKSGALPETAPTLARNIAQLPGVSLRGLMTIEPASGNPENARPYFRELKVLFDAVIALGLNIPDFNILSMGMTHTYLIAVQEGATIVRVGTAIFGARPQ